MFEAQEILFGLLILLTVALMVIIFLILRKQRQLARARVEGAEQQAAAPEKGKEPEEGEGKKPAEEKPEEKAEKPPKEGPETGPTDIAAIKASIMAAGKEPAKQAAEPEKHEAPPAEEPAEKEPEPPPEKKKPKKKKGKAAKPAPAEEEKPAEPTPEEPAPAAKEPSRKEESIVEDGVELGGKEYMAMPFPEEKRPTKAEEDIEFIGRGEYERPGEEAGAGPAPGPGAETGGEKGAEAGKDKIAEAAMKPVPEPSDTTRVTAAELSGSPRSFLGKRVSAEGIINLSSKGKDDFWYVLFDDTGSAVVRSKEEIPFDRCVLFAEVKETRLGQTYLDVQRYDSA